MRRQSDDQSRSRSRSSSSPRCVEAVDAQARAGRRSGCARGHQADELQPSTSMPRRLASSVHSFDDVVEAQPPPSPPRSCSPGRRPRAEASRPSARTPGKPPPLSHDGRDRLGRVDVLRAEVDVERDQRLGGAPTMTPPAAGVERSPARDRAPARPRRAGAPTLRPATTEVRRAPAAADLAVEEDRQRELVRDPLGEPHGGRTRPCHVTGDDRDERNDV